MSTLEQLLRDTLADVAADAPAGAPDRADRALGTVRRRRAALALAAAAAVAAVVGGAVLVPLRAGGDGPAVPARPAPSTTASSRSPVAEPAAVPLPAFPPTGGFTLSAAAESGSDQATVLGTAVRAPNTPSWYASPYGANAVSRTGRLAVLDSTDPTAQATRVGVIDDIARPAVRWVRLPAAARHPVWSPDGRRLLLTRLNQDAASGRLGFVVLDTVTWTVTSVNLAPDADTEGSLGPGSLGVYWDPSGTSVVGPVAAPDDYTGVPKWALRWWRLDGTELRTVRTAGLVATSGAQLLSPLGRRAAAVVGKQRLAVIDTSTGRETVQLPAGTETVYGWQDEDHVIVRAGAGAELWGVDGERTLYVGGTRGADLSVTGL